MAETSADAAPPELHCRWCHKPISPDVHLALRETLRALRHPLRPMDHRGDPPLCPQHVAEKISDAARQETRQAERHAAREPWRQYR